MYPFHCSIDIIRLRSAFLIVHVFRLLISPYISNLKNYFLPWQTAQLLFHLQCCSLGHEMGPIRSLANLISGIDTLVMFKKSQQQKLFDQSYCFIKISLINFLFPMFSMYLFSFASLPIIADSQEFILTLNSFIQQTFIEQPLRKVPPYSYYPNFIPAPYPSDLSISCPLLSVFVSRCSFFNTEIEQIIKLKIMTSKAEFRQ